MPEPSRLVLLEELQDITAGTKVRFLGCVHGYDGPHAQVALRCSYPATDRKIPTAIVKIENVLETINHELLQTGAWLNVVGYVEQPLFADSKRKAKSTPLVAATMIWSAGAVKLDRYESAVQGYQEPLIPG